MRHRLTPLVLAGLLSGCQALPGGHTEAPDDPLADAPPVEHGLDAEGLAGLLTAEFAGQRGDFRRASRGFLAGAERYGSVALAERAALAARFGNDDQLLAESADRWQALAPTSDSPARLLASLAIQRGDWVAALEQRLRIVELGGEGELADLVENALAQDAAPSPLLDRLGNHLAERAAPDAPRAHDAELAMAILEAADGQDTAARRRLDRLADRAPELPELWLTRARLAQEAGDDDGARAAARRGLAIAPDDARFILLVAQSELRLGNLPAAEAQTDALLENHRGGDELRLALARLYLDERHPQAARRLLLPLVDEADTPPRAFYLLGASAEEEGEHDNALLYYRQVAEGEEFLPARLRGARMLIEDDRLDDARTFLRIERLRHEDASADLVTLEVELLDEQGLDDEADALLDGELGRNPDDTDLRYLRAMRAFADGDPAAMERDLRGIIDRDPDNAAALNALGYTLADLEMEGRLDEARRLIERAHELDPDNAAILDSQGWVRFRQGDPASALPWLERAWAAMPDQEVAAHLAEVLWVLGREERARKLVRESLERFDERPVLDDLLERIPELAPDTR
jgi:Tfp pilus assembly protein PilF